MTSDNERTTLEAFMAFCDIATAPDYNEEGMRLRDIVVAALTAPLAEATCPHDATVLQRRCAVCFTVVTDVADCTDDHRCQYHNEHGMCGLCIVVDCDGYDGCGHTQPTPIDEPTASPAEAT
ncbi:hypothetical protein LCGC14_2140320 [marine sediment metagenome]|uniref:Uncharacterized protein n=1 Tax=marine sediment metagenome TaxID=412755 RepID=A0A0F9DYV1_9ZZZZ